MAPSGGRAELLELSPFLYPGFIPRFSIKFLNVRLSLSLFLPTSPLYSLLPSVLLGYTFNVLLRCLHYSLPIIISQLWFSWFSSTSSLFHPIIILTLLFLIIVLRPKSSFFLYSSAPSLVFFFPPFPFHSSLSVFFFFSIQFSNFLSRLCPLFDPVYLPLLWNCIPLFILSLPLLSSFQSSFYLCLPVFPSPYVYLFLSPSRALP